MDFNINIPVRIVSGLDCVKKNGELFSLGSNAFIVTGKNGARMSGALDDVVEVLDALGIGFKIFDAVTENPPLLTCHAGGLLAEKNNADFIIAIGGGSVIDAGKAIAAFAANSDISPLDIYDANIRKKPSLPIIAVPTTAGTGSEANQYSVLTLPDGVTKKTFSSPYCWAKYSFLDPKYTFTLPYGYTVSTALDAFAHALESFLSPKASEFSQMTALFAAEKIWHIIKSFPKDFSPLQRTDLLYAADAAGIAISITGTGFPHPLGYSLTLLDKIPHGLACAVFDIDFIEYNLKCAKGEKLLAKFFAHLGTNVKEITAVLAGYTSHIALSFDKDAIEKRVSLIRNAKNYTNSPYVLSVTEIYDIYEKHFAL